MSIRLRCSGCERNLKIPEKAAGSRIKCPACDQILLVPKLAARGDDEFDDLLSEESFEDQSVPEKLPPAKKAAKTRGRSASKQSRKTPEPPDETLHPAILPAAVCAGGLLFGALVMWLASGSGGGSGGNAAGVENGAASSPEAAVADMHRLLMEKNYPEFVKKYAPVQTLRDFRTAEQQESILKGVSSPELAETFELLKSGSADIDSTGALAKLIASEESSADSGPAVAAGYGDDLKQVIRQGIQDLEQGRIKEFITKIFPPEALALMQSGTPGQTRLDIVSKDSLLVERMLADLKQLEKVTAQIDGNVAEFVLAPQTFPEDVKRAVRPDLTGLLPPDRKVRFSLIGGSWRFYAGVSSSDLQSADGGSVAVELELIGSNWRLVELP